MLLSLVIILLVIFNHIQAQISCGADKIKATSITKNENVYPIQTDDYQPIRLTIDTSQLRPHWRGYDRLEYFISDVIPAAEEWVEQVINVQQGLYMISHCLLWSSQTQQMYMINSSW